jgi:hypothetical protein
MSRAYAWGEAQGGLQAGLWAVDEHLGVALRNVGAEPLTVLSHVDAGTTHLDWYVVSLTGADGSTRPLYLFDDRDESGPVAVVLAPGELVSHTIDLLWWAKRSPNADEPLLPGEYEASVTYEVSDDDAELDSAWSGRLDSGAVTVVLPGS